MKSKKARNYQVIGLVGRAHLDFKSTYIQNLAAHLLKKKCQVLWDAHISEILGKQNEQERPYILKHADIVLSLGGDGTLLKLVRDLPKRKNLYVVGINLGHLGFNTEIRDPGKGFTELDEFLKGRHHIDERLLLRITLYREGKKIATHLALNDAVINQGNFARLISLHAEIDQRKMISFKSDGVILATPTGSTGHSLSAGGPILHPRIEAMIFTPICPSELTVRPIVIPSNRQITITIETERRYKDNTIGLTIDGQIVLPLQYGDQIKIRASSRKLRFFRKISGEGYYKLLRDKLNWGR